MNIKKFILFILCLSIFACMVSGMQVFAEVVSSADVAMEERNVWVSSDFSTIDDGWILSNGMYHDGNDGVVRLDEATGTDLAEAYYSLDGLDFGNSWNIRFRMKLEEEHQGRVDFHFIYGGYRTYCVVTPEENKFSLQGNGSRTDRETLRGIWYEYLFQYYIEDGVTKLKIWRRPEGDDFWLDIFTGYPFSDVNLYSGPPALRFFGGVAGDGKKLTIDDVRVYAGTYARLKEPLVQGNRVTVGGVIDTSDYGMTKERQVTLLAVSYDKKYGYTKEIQSTKVVVEPGQEIELNHTFYFDSLNSKNDYVTVMMWDAMESGVPLAVATGFVHKDTSNDVPTSGQGIGVTPIVVYNEIKLNGYLGEANGKITACLVKDNCVYAILQGMANENGMISTKLVADPACESGAYILRIQYGNTVATETQVNLQCNDSLAESYGSINDIVGENIVPHKSIDFTDKNASSLYSGSGYYSAGSRYFNRITGLSLDSTTKETYWRYAPVANWFVIGDRRSVKIRAKMTDETNPLEFRIFEPNKSYAAHEFVLTSNGISTGCTYKSLNTEFAPGTDWVDYLVVKTSTGIKVYASKENFLCGRWIPVLETTAPNASYASTIGGIHVVGTGMISSVDIYNTNASKVESVETIVDGDIATIYNFQMDENFSRTSDLTCSGTYVYGEDGLSLTTGTWKFVPSSDWYALKKNYAVFLRTKMADPANTLTVCFSSEYGTAKMQLSSTGLIAYNGVGSARKLVSFSGTEWIDYLILQNQFGGYSVYATNDFISGWYKVAETEDYPEAADKSLGIEISGSGVVQIVKQLQISGTITDIGSKPSNAKTAYYQEEFCSMPMQQSNVLIQNGKMDDSNLILKDGSYSVNHGGIPLGGYVEFRIYAGGTTEFITADGEKGITITMQDGSYTLHAGTTQKIEIGDGANVFKTWRIVRNNNGTYSGYCKSDGDYAWYPAFLNITGKSDAASPVTAFSVADGSMVCDYLMLYGPTMDEGLILTDGYGTKILSNGEKYQYHDCIRALVSLDESRPQTVLFVEYVGGALYDWERKEVPAGSGTISVPYAVKNSMADIKVFLWDSLPGMVATGKAQSASHNWTLSGNARDLNGGVSMNLESGGKSIASFSGEIGENFDIEWTMRISSFTGTERTCVYTGKHQITLNFNADEISYLTNTGTKSIPSSVGTSSHAYRLIGKQGVCYLYMDDVFVAVLADFPESTETPRIDFLTGN